MICLLISTISFLCGYYVSWLNYMHKADKAYDAGYHDSLVLLPCGCEPHGHKCLISEGGCGRCVEHCTCVSPTFGPRCLECGYPLTKEDPPETDKCKSCYEDME